ncbi:MAG: hypothetical protein OEL53_04385 [Rhodospirillales bacterium]|nr:hypothetical protein [Rhodospirillales bacterium]
MNDLALHPALDSGERAGRPLFGLSLCSGAGGLDLGLAIAEPGYRTVGYVERDAFAAAVLVARMADAALDQAVVWDDLGRFDGRAWRGALDKLDTVPTCPNPVPFTLIAVAMSVPCEGYFQPSI